MKKRVKTVAIIGGGPSGLTLASLLAMRGVEVTVFEDGKRPDLIVGESLVPAIVPVLRRLGIEERVAAIGLHKPGVSFTMPGRERVNFNFKNVERCHLPTYAYNVPRPAFDDILDMRASELGARRVTTRAKLERDGDEQTATRRGNPRASALARRPPAGFARGLHRKEPALRALARNPGLDRTAPRRSALRAFRRVSKRTSLADRSSSAGCKSGWNWRIPLPGRLSVGVVMNRDEAARLGSSPEERLENAIARDPVLAAAGLRTAAASPKSPRTRTIS